MNSTATDTVLGVRHFTKSYNGHNVVEDLSFSLNRGEVVGLIGPNGAGKTTIMKALIGLVAPSGGELVIWAYEHGHRDRA